MPNERRFLLGTYDGDDFIVDGGYLLILYRELTCCVQSRNNDVYELVYRPDLSKPPEPEADEKLKRLEKKVEEYRQEQIALNRRFNSHEKDDS